MSRTYFRFSRENCLSLPWIAAVLFHCLWLGWWLICQTLYTTTVRLNSPPQQTNTRNPPRPTDEPSQPTSSTAILAIGHSVFMTSLEDRVNLGPNHNVLPFLSAWFLCLHRLCHLAYMMPLTLMVRDIWCYEILFLTFWPSFKSFRAAQRWQLNISQLIYR